VDLIQAAQRRIEAPRAADANEEIDENLWLRVDSFSLLQGLPICYRLKDDYGIREVRFRSARRAGSRTGPDLSGRWWLRRC